MSAPVETHEEAFERHAVPQPSLGLFLGHIYLGILRIFGLVRE